MAREAPAQLVSQQPWLIHVHQLHYQSSGSLGPLTLPALTHTLACLPPWLMGREVWLVGWRPHPPSLSSGAVHGHPDWPGT